MKLTAIAWSSHAEAIAAAAARVPEADVRLFASKALDLDPEKVDQAVRAVAEADALFLYRSTEAFWDTLEPAIREAAASKPVVCLSYDPSFWALSSADAEALDVAHRFLTYGGDANMDNLLRFMASSLCGEEVAWEPPVPVPWEGLYHPDAPVTHFPDAMEYLRWYAGHARDRGLSDAPWVGLLLARHFWVNGNTEVEAALIRELEGKGLRVLPAFSNSLKDLNLGNRGALAWCREVFLAEGGPRIEVLVKLMPFFLGGGGGTGEERAAEGGDLFRELDAPVLQPVFTSAKTVEQWEQDPQGLGTEVSWAVAMPEFEGVIEPFLLGGGTKRTDGVTGADLERRVPVPERCTRLAGRVARWVALRRTPVAERKVAFILHNNPCASVEASVGGASKLDSLESAARILKAMGAAGYDVRPPADGEELIRTIMDRKAVSEFRWTTVDEIVRKGGALARVPVERYQQWYDTFPASVRESLDATWGAPPGEEKDGVPAAMVHEGAILVTGVEYGNAVFCVQPKRGCAGPRCDGRVCKILHDPDIPPPHQYLATYHWLMDDFGADVIVHVGTHGTLEFLPGKSVGLSGACLPDIAIRDCPHLYIYNADNPAEGVIAKRRSYACLVDHMTTLMAQSGLYEELEEVDRLLGEYEQAKQADKSRAHQLEHLIRDGLAAASLDTQVKPDECADFDEVTRRAHEALALIRNTRIDEGMHVMGELPEGGRLAEYIYNIMRYDAGEPRSLRRSLCGLLNLDLDRLLSDPGEVDPTLRRSHGELLEFIDVLGAGVVGLALDHPGDDEAFRLGLDGLAAEAAPAGLVPDDSVLVEIADFRPRMADIAARIGASQEIDALLHGFSGGHIPAGPSGVISRGREDILPTGRNFFTLDPKRLPTKAAFRVGRLLADEIIRKHVEEEGRPPENVAMFWMCNDMMWADGEGMGQIFWLLGVRPAWLSNGRVNGFEVVPLSELGRPRVDVTVRVSGLLRDSFPEAVELVDEAVQAVAALDEDPEANYVRKHALEKADGDEDGDGWRQATLRIFSAKPGTYQAGVNLAVYASAWKDEADLSEIFVYWNSYAYGKDLFGERAPEALKASLSTVDVTYNKVVSDEHDLFGCCAYYGTHGGLTAAARHLKGGEVRSYYGDTREPAHVAVRDLADEVRRVVRTKLLNPKWIEGMKRHGYKGAGDISKRVGRVYGWEATTGEVDDWIFDDIAATFILDEENREFFRENNPWALEEIGRRLLEAHGRGLWDADPEVIDGLRRTYLEMEGWLEENMGDVTGDFQGGAVDVFSADDVEQWRKMMRDMDRE